MSSQEMVILQKVFDREIKKYFTEILWPSIIKKRLNELGIILTKTQYKKIKDQVKNLDKNGLELKFKDSQVINAGFKSEIELQDALKSLPDDILNDSEQSIDDYLSSLPNTLNEISDKASIDILNNLKRQSKKQLKLRRKDFSKFESRLRKSWKLAFDLLEMLIAISIETGDSFNNEQREIAQKNNDFIFDALTRLHARACQISSEIMVLLKSGYADGAHARWRSLHEVVVFALFISSNGNDLAERYLLHDGVESYKSALIYQDHCRKLGSEPLNDDELGELKMIYDGLINRFGKDYSKNYGWVYPTIDIKNPTFKQIEEATGLEHLRPYYKMASNNIHANPRGIFFKLGLYSDEEILLAGPSNIGLTDPGHSTALSLAQITISLLTHSVNLDRLVICKTLLKLQDEIGVAFLNAQATIDDKHDNEKRDSVELQPV